MLDSKQIKNLGLRFARALQTTIKTAGVFTIEHKSADRPVQQSFLLLNNLLKETGQFTFGFVENQVMLNNLLTVDPSLRQLETEFLKRGVAAITFEAGLTLTRYKKVIHVLAATTATLEAAGGFLAFLNQNEIDGVRILPAARNQKKNEQGDTVLETDSESYILSKQLNEDQAPRDFLDSIDALLESGCFDPSTRSEVISNFTTGGMDGQGYGVPIDVPKLAIVKDGEVVGPAGRMPGSDGGHPGGGGYALTAAAGHAGPVQTSGAVPGAVGDHGQLGRVPATSGNPGATGYAPVGYVTQMAAAPGEMRQGSLVSGGGPGTGTGGGPGGGTGGGPGRGRPGNLGSGTFLELVEASVQRSLLEEKGSPQKSYTSLARILRNTGVDKILERFPAERREQLRACTPEQLAAEYIEDTALQLAGEKLKSESASPDKLVLEEEVVHLLSRSLQATHMADRLAQKLTKFIQDFAVPPHIQEKIREELQWTSLVGSKKYSRLMEIQRYNKLEFRRLLEFSKELVTQRDMDRAASLVSHYFDFLDDPAARIETAELSRVPELIHTVPLAHVGFASKNAERLTRVLLREDVSDFIHFQAASALSVLAQSIAAFENFQDVLAIGAALEASKNRDSEKHKKCCSEGLARILSVPAIERIIELYLEQRGDSAWGKTAATLLRFAAPGSIENVFSRLICEEDGRSRLALVRLVGQFGSGSVDVAHRYLSDDRWYVVRNMCSVLAELKDPDLVEHIAPALRHPDARVQQAALKTLVKSRSVSAASVLAASLPSLSPGVLDEALDELMFLRNASAIQDLEEFVSARRGNLPVLKKAAQALGAIHDDGALYALTRLVRIEELDREIRRTALIAISNHRSPVATTVLTELAASWGPLAEEARSALDRRKSKP